MSALGAAKASNSEEVSGDFVLTDANFRFFCKLANGHTGIVLNDAKRQMIYSRLVRRIRALKLDGFDAYCKRLEAGDQAEFVEFINAITTNLTAFFRENHHFEHLRNIVMPQLMEAHAADRRIRIWSAGCSTGEEPYSLAITIAETIPNIDTWDVRILATDVDTNVLAKAASGVYEDKRVEGVKREYLQRWFMRGTGEQAGSVRLREEVRSLISFKQLNLMNEWPMRGPFDVIFCRNVVIYFDKPTQTKLFNRYADLMVPRGHLYIGHSENLFKVSDRFTPLGQTIYQRCK
ncbi:MAG: protein-glutamate O-methyltransferase CheR [Gammaproteobacteria bacterium]